MNYYGKTELTQEEKDTIANTVVRAIDMNDGYCKEFVCVRCGWVREVFADEFENSSDWCEECDDARIDIEWVQNNYE